MLTLPGRAGPHDPLPSTADRRPGSVRRTASIDSTRPDGLAGDVQVDARARDLWTGPDGAVQEEHVSLRAVIDPMRGLRTAEATPDAPALGLLAGASVASGFRRQAVDALPGDAERRTLLNLLLDDLPGAALVSGFALKHAHTEPTATPGMRAYILAAADVCAGWVADGTMMEAFRAHDQMPTPIGPPAPVLERADDPLDWHAMAALPPHGTRRRRCLDVWPAPDPGGSTHRFEAHFRDSHVDAEGAETIIHEYLVAGTVDASTGAFSSLDAEARVLPWVECPGALASAQRLVGTPFADVRARVRNEFTGASTCTHLNDTLRSLADLGPLLAGLGGGTSER